MRRAACLLSILTVFGPIPAGAVDDGGTQSPLMLGAGARPLAMGRAAVAISDDANALFWNPARLPAVQRGELSLFHSKLFVDGLGYQAGFLTIPTLDLGTFAAGYQRLGADGIDARDDRNGPLAEFDASESNVLFGYGREVGRGVTGGATFRISQQKVGDASDTGFGLDVGVAVERNLGSTADHRWSAGVNLQNLLAPDIQLDQEGVADPRNLKLGIGYQGKPHWNRVGVALALDLDLPSEGEARVGGGAEVGLDDMFFVRGGSDSGHLTLGFGLSVHGIQFDYAMRNDDELARNDRFTLGVRFGASVVERRAVRQQERQTAVQEQLESLLQEREKRALELARSDADVAFRAGDDEEARLRYRRVLAMDPGDSLAVARIDLCELRLALGGAQAELESAGPVPAIAAYQAVLHRWPSNEEARSRLQQLREQLERAEDREKQIDLLLREALTQFSEADYLGAAASLDELLRLDPGNAMGRELLGRAERLRAEKGEQELVRARQLAAAGRWSEALRALETAGQTLPDRGSEIHALAGQWSQEWESAREAQARARAAEAERAAAAQAAPETASSPVTAPAPAAPSAERQASLQAHFEQGMDAFRAGKFETATRIWQTIWDEWPSFPHVADYLVKAHLYQAIELYGQGRYRDAVEHCRRVLDVDPENQKAMRYLSSIEEEQRTLRERSVQGR